MRYLRLRPTSKLAAGKSNKKTLPMLSSGPTSLRHTRWGGLNTGLPYSWRENRATQGAACLTEGSNSSRKQAFGVFLPCWFTFCVHLWNQQGPISSGTKVKSLHKNLTNKDGQLHDSFLIIVPDGTDKILFLRRSMCTHMYVRYRPLPFPWKVTSMYRCLKETVDSFWLRNIENVKWVQSSTSSGNHTRPLAFSTLCVSLKGVP